jgi:hypothetical protein
MSEFKFACPVCGQHMMCDSSSGGTVMECPTCFQKITAPQAPSSDEQKFIITGTKKSERPVSTIPETASTFAPAKKGFPGALIVVIIFILIGAAAAFVYQGTIFKSANPPTVPPVPPSSSPPLPVMTVPFNLPLPVGTNYWTLNVNAVGTPEIPAGGKVHGKFFTGQKMVLNADGLTIRTASYPPEAGITVYLRPDPIESLFGKSIVFEADTPGAPQVFLRWKDAQGQAAQQAATGYAMRIEFGQPAGNNISGKIYLCTPDEMKSYVVGRFNAEIVKPKPLQ